MGEVSEVSGRPAFDANQLGLVLGAVAGAALLGWAGLGGLVGGWTVGGIAGAEVGPVLLAGRHGDRTTVRGRMVRLVGSLAVGTAVLLATTAHQYSGVFVRSAAFVLASLVALCLLLNCRRPASGARVVVGSWGGILLVALFVSFLATGLGSSVGAGPGNETPTVTMAAAAEPTGNVAAANASGSAGNAEAAAGNAGDAGSPGTTTDSTAEEPTIQYDVGPPAGEDEQAEAGEEAGPDEPGVVGPQPASSADDPLVAGNGVLPTPLRNPGILAVLGVLAVLAGTLPRFRRG